MYRFEQYFQVYKLNLSKTQQHPQTLYAPSETSTSKLSREHKIEIRLL